MELVRGAWHLYRSHFRLVVGCAGMVTVLQALELFYVPTWLAPVVFLALWPVIIGVVSQAIAESGAGRTPPSVQAVYESIGRRGLLKLVVANVLLAMMVVLGLVLLIVPGVYLWVRFQFVPQVLVRERTRLFDAFSHSSNLVRGRWWRVFGAVVAVYAAATVVNVVVFAVISLIGVSLHWSEMAIGLVMIVGISAVWALMDPMVFGVLLLLYADLRRTRQQPVASLPA